tara:strand:- start:478 stop:1326 length:849 start_codon:yes stop_codon:yes gene_type:complete
MKNIPLFYYNYPNGIPNIGDYLGKFIVENLSSKQITYTDFVSDVKKYATIGSIINQAAGKNTIFWGSGIKSEKWIPPSHSKYLAVRGPLTYRMLNNNNIQCPKILGDPALLLPLILEKPKISVKYNIGIVPHYFDERFIQREFEKANLKEVTVISCETDDVKGFVRKISQCEFIISSSLHGVIISQAFGVPAIWMRFSEDDRIGSSSPFKFHDYFLSCSIELYTPPVVNPLEDYEKMLGLLKNNKHLMSINNFNILPLIDSCPFLNSSSKDEFKNKVISHGW